MVRDWRDDELMLAVAWLKSLFHHVTSSVVSMTEGASREGEGTPTKR